MNDKSCGWTGFVFGAHYEDGICGNGRLWDLDSCDEPGGPLLHGGDHLCPQCEGTGIPVNGERGPMAFHRKQAREEIEELLSECEEDLADILRNHIDGLFSLVRKLEEPEQATLSFQVEG